MTSPLPPRLRDTRTIADRVRQDRTNLSQLGVGFVGGRFPPVRPLGAAALFGDLEADDEADEESEQDQVRFWNTDTLTVSGPGTQVLALTYMPLDGSLHVYWGSLFVPPANWSLNENVLTITDPLGLFASDDLISTAYAYIDTEVLGPTSGTLVPFLSAGWSHKQVSLGDGTDYSDPDYDDSAWSVGAGMFGNGVGSGAGAATAWAADTSIWLRRTVTTRPGMRITIPVEDGCIVYVNGTNIGATGIAGVGASNLVPPYVVDVPDDLAGGTTWVLAVRANDEAGGSSDETSVDVKVTYGGA